MQRPGGYSATQIALHWIVALLVFGQYVFNEGISRAWNAHRAGETVSFDPLVAAHVAGGGLILVCVVWRLTLRLRRGAPSPHANEPVGLVRVSGIAHWAFYAVLAAMSVTGPAAWFGDVASAARAHNVLKLILLALVALHVLAVPFHLIVLKTDVMRRMLRPAP